jgi:hypothetical protein
MTESEVLAISRAVERPIIVAICGMSIYLGYRLFYLGIVEYQKAKVDAYGWKVALDKVGPGIFFALFGMIGLAVSSTHGFRFSDNGSQVSSLSSEDANMVRAEVRALNAAIDPRLSEGTTSCEPLIGDLKAGRPYLMTLRQQLLETVFSQDDLNDWKKNKDLLHAGQIRDRARAARLMKISSYLEEKN